MIEARAEASRNDQLDGLRGYAAVAVVFFHSILGIDPTLIDRVLYQRFSTIEGPYNLFAKTTLAILNGHTAVVIFFILSGSVLFDNLRRDQGSPFAVLLKFFVRRFFRIYPALLVCLVVCWFTFNVVGIPLSANQLMQNLVLYSFAVNGATWTLNVEAFGALLIVIAYFGYRHLGELGIILVGCIFASAYLKPFEGWLVFFKLFTYSFILGMMIPTRLGQWVIGYIPSLAWPLLLIGMVVARSTIHETITALLVGLLYYRKAGALGEFLSKPLSIFLGVISYSLYLFNVLFLEVIVHYLRMYPAVVGHPVEFGILAAIVIIGLTIPVAYWSVRLIERPFIRLGQHLTRSHRDVVSA